LDVLVCFQLFNYQHPVMLIAFVEVLPKSQEGKSAESSTLVFSAKCEAYNKNYPESLCFSLLSGVLIYKK
jgi:hypothetical protein